MTSSTKPRYVLSSGAAMLPHPSKVLHRSLISWNMLFIILSVFLLFLHLHPPKKHLDYLFSMHAWEPPCQVDLLHDVCNEMVSDILLPIRLCSDVVCVCYLNISGHYEPQLYSVLAKTFRE